MKNQQMPLIVGLIAIIVVAAGIVFWQMRPSTPASSTVMTSDTPMPQGMTPSGGQSQPTGAASPTDEARSRGEFTPAPK